MQGLGAFSSLVCDDKAGEPSPNKSVIPTMSQRHCRFPIAKSLLRWQLWGGELSSRPRSFSREFPLNTGDSLQLKGALRSEQRQHTRHLLGRALCVLRPCEMTTVRISGMPTETGVSGPRIFPFPKPCSHRLIRLGLALIAMLWRQGLWRPGGRVFLHDGGLGAGTLAFITCCRQL